MIFRVLVEPSVSIAITGVERDSYLVGSWSLPSGPLQASLVSVYLFIPPSPHLPPPLRRLFQVASTRLHFCPVCTDLFGAGIMCKLLIEKSRT